MARCTGVPCWVDRICYRSGRLISKLFPFMVFTMFVLFVYHFLLCHTFEDRHPDWGMRHAGSFELNKMIYITLPEITPQTLPWHIDTALAGATLMIIGFHIKERGWQKIAEKNIFIFLSLLGIGGVTGWMNLGKVGFASNIIDNPVCMAVHACAMTLVLIAFGEKICKTAIGGFLIFCGKSTMIFMGFNYFFNRHSERLWQSLPILNKFEYHWVIKVIVVTACLCLTSYLWNLVKTHGINCHRWPKKDNCGKESG